MGRWSLALLSLGALALVGCREPAGVAGGAAPMQGERNGQNSFLAYEHSVSIELPGDSVQTRFDATQEACRSNRFGACNLISAEQNTGKHAYANLTLRIVPEGVEKILAFAGEGGEFVRRNTRTEDLADAVADNAQQRQRLALQRQTLLQYQARPDLSVSDMLALAKELAAVEVQSRAVAQAAERQQQRIASNLLSLEFRSAYQPDGRLTTIAEAFGGLLDQVAEGTVAAIRFIGYGLPFLILLFPLALLVRWLWRRVAPWRKA